MNFGLEVMVEPRGTDGVVLRVLGRGGDPVDMSGSEAREIGRYLEELVGEAQGDAPISDGRDHAPPSPHLLDPSEFPRVYAALDRGGTICFRAMSLEGDPVVLSHAEARHVAKRLFDLADQYQRWVPKPLDG